MSSWSIGDSGKVIVRGDPIMLRLLARRMEIHLMESVSRGMRGVRQREEASIALPNAEVVGRYREGRWTVDGRRRTSKEERTAGQA